jgi:hypothetical protein
MEKDMKKKYIYVMVIALLSLSGSIALATSSQTGSFIEFLTQPLIDLGLSQSMEKEEKIPAMTTEKTAKSGGGTNELTGIEKDKKDLVDFYVLFKFADFLEKEAKKAELVGEDTSEYRKFFVREANLTEPQNEMFRQIVSDCIREVSETDAQALEVIRKEHEKWESIDFAALGNKLLPEVPELRELQEKRDEAILRYRDLLKTLLGDAAFTQFQEEYLNKKVTPNIKIISSLQTPANGIVKEAK